MTPGYGGKGPAREAGRIFALPTYLLAGSVVLMIITGVVRELTGGLPHAVPGHGTISVGSHPAASLRSCVSRQP